VGDIRFAWEGRKAKSNLAKHGRLVRGIPGRLLDEHAGLMDDPDHSREEERFVLLGYSFPACCLIVSHCYRESDSLIRLISARRAMPQEEQMYWELK
jgi:uncharacterized DUF497 family protein